MTAANQHTDLPTLVFDLDGTLADTAVDLIGTLNVLMRRLGAPEVPVEQGQGRRGRRRARDDPARPCPRRAIRLRADIETLFQEFLVHYAENIAVKTELYPGVRAALDRLALAGYRLAVCTNKPEEHSIRLLAALGVADRFGSICGRDTFAYAKPDPRHLTLTVEKAGGDPGHAIMIGDSRTDVDTARAAGLPVIAVSFGYTDTPVEKLGPDRIVDHFDELELGDSRLPAPNAGRRLKPISARERRDRCCRGTGNSQIQRQLPRR